MRWKWPVGGITLAALAVYILVFWPMRDPHPIPRPIHGTLAIRNAKIYLSPDDPPVEKGVIVVRDGLIEAVGPAAPIPADARILSCDHCVVMAGFWNTHVHFTEPKWDWAAWKPASTLNAQLADMLTSHGFTTVVDAASDLRITLSLRRRIESGDLTGPKIYTAGYAEYPPDGLPFYVRRNLPFWLIWLVNEPSTPAEAAGDEERNIADGADILKLFTGSYVAPGKVLPMPLANAKAAVEVAHRHGQLAYAHPSDLAGTTVAIDSGVDVLAHAPDTTEGIDEALIEKMVTRRMTMIPTLKMFATTVTKNPSYLQPIYAIVRRFHELGGRLMFGTDVGYMSDYTTSDEFTALAQCGLNTRDILRMLTTAPAQRFGVADRQGTITPGKAGDITVLDQDPDPDVAAFARIRYAIGNGRVLYTAP